jgi:hypothetical protein
MRSLCLSYTSVNKAIFEGRECRQSNYDCPKVTKYARCMCLVNNILPRLQPCISPLAVPMRRLPIPLLPLPAVTAAAAAVAAVCQLNRSFVRRFSRRFIRQPALLLALAPSLSRFVQQPAAAAWVARWTKSLANEFLLNHNVYNLTRYEFVMLQRKQTIIIMYVCICHPWRKQPATSRPTDRPPSGSPNAYQDT